MIVQEQAREAVAAPRETAEAVAAAGCSLRTVRGSQSAVGSLEAQVPITPKRVNGVETKPRLGLLGYLAGRFGWDA